MLKGSIVALVTPFTAENEIDYEELKRLLEFHIENQTDGLLLLGTTAEAESLSDSEKLEMVEYCLRILENKIPVMVGIIANHPKKTVELSNLFKNLSFDSYLVSAPFYVKSNTEGLLKHFLYIAERVDKPLVLYNVPKRTGIELDYDLVKILSYHPNIIGIKEASGNIAYQTHIATLCKEDFVLYGGDDSTLLATLALGGSGVISVIGNAFPKELKVILSSFEKNPNISRLVYNKLLPLIDDIFTETSPIPIKYLLFLLGFKTRKLRLPLAEASIKLRRKLEEDYLNYIDED